MRVSELEAGGIYAFNSRAGGTDWAVGLLLDVEPWVDPWQGKPRPQTQEDRDANRRHGHTGRIRDVPMLDFVARVTLADGSAHRLPFGPWFHLRARGWGAGYVRPEQVYVELEPTLVNIRNITRRIA